MEHIKNEQLLLLQQNLTYEVYEKFGVTPDKVIDGKNSPLETFTSCFVAFKLALSALSFELFLKASDKVLTKSSA